jgi:hypothetical protein
LGLLVCSQSPRWLGCFFHQKQFCRLILVIGVDETLSPCVVKGFDRRKRW